MRLFKTKSLNKMKSLSSWLLLKNRKSRRMQEKSLRLNRKKKGKLRRKLERKRKRHFKKN
jgi:hypothetical protein